MKVKSSPFEPIVINSVIPKSSDQQTVSIATGNQGKLAEFSEILKGYEIIGKDLKMHEVQSLDPIEVVSEKAKEAWRLNNFNPIVVEDTALEILGLGGRPGTLTDYFTSEIEMRRMICEKWLGEDRRARAIVTLAIYDGNEVHTRQGITTGEIALTLRGNNGFSWDDMFIPDGQKTKTPKTFAEMTSDEKNVYSMRKKALEKFIKDPFDMTPPIFMLDEPTKQEISRIRINELNDPKALKFAYSLEALGGNKVSKTLVADKYFNVTKEGGEFFDRYTNNIKSNSLGLLFTDIDKVKLRTYENLEPYLWQFGPERRKLAIAQRAEFFLDNINKDTEEAIDHLEEFKGFFPKRSNRIQPAIEHALGLDKGSHITGTYSFKELGYKKVSSDKLVSRTKIAKTGLYNKIGKEIRSYFCIGSLPPVSGWRDVIVTSAIANSAIFVHRNSLHAGNTERQIALINSAKTTIRELKLKKKLEDRAMRNIGAALGCDPVRDTKNAKELFNKAGVTLFRIYTINSDPRVIETARAIRKALGDKVEIFVGQVTDKSQAYKLVASDIRADALILGHGGGRQCTSATNGMAVTTLEEVYKLTTDNMFNETSILVEGGVGTSVGPIMLLGIDGICYNQQFTKGTIETGDIFFEHKNGKFCQPYHGSASAPTMLIEAANMEENMNKVSASGRALKVEGKPGYTFYEKKANSMAFYINEFKHYGARTLADLGVESIWELREFLRETDKQLLRLVSTEAQVIGSAYRS